MSDPMTLFLMTVMSQALFASVVIGVMLWLDKMQERDARDIFRQLNMIVSLIEQGHRRHQAESNKEHGEDVRPFSVRHTNGAHHVGPRPPKAAAKPALPVVVKYESDYHKTPTVANTGPIGTPQPNGEWSDMIGFGG